MADHNCKHGHPQTSYCGLCQAEKAPRCRHGNPFYCGFCAEDGKQRCKHGHANYCGFCGPVT